MSDKPPAKKPAAAKPQAANKPAPARPANRPAPANKPAPANAGPAKPMPAKQQAMAAQAQPAGAGGGREDDEDFVESGSSRFLLFMAMPSWMVSMIVHVVALLILALVSFGVEQIQTTSEFTMDQEEEEEVEVLEEFEEIELEELDVNTEAVEVAEFTPQESEVDPIEPEVTVANDADLAAVEVPEIDPLGEMKVEKSDLLATQGAYGGTGVEGRGAAARGQLVAAGGGNAASEAAVARALKWIASRQGVDGGWNFNHNLSANPRPCPNPGTAQKARNGATGLALLPFLGAGQTHKEGTYKKQVTGGLRYLIQNMKVKDRTGSWHEPEGSMYSHGIAAIAMCEAYAMTHDKELLAPAQLSLNFIVYAQDPVGGGWRYSPRQAGDTSAVGWQLMALKSGHMAYLEVPKGTILGAMKFLDSVQADSGAQYGYTGPATGRAGTNAVGMLSRMYLGWKKDNPAVQRGVARFDKSGPSKSNMYYNYYATQVVRHYEGEEWKRWNARMRDWLVEAQSKEGVTEGSWWLGGSDHGAHRGGRLYTTAMATMMLEVYYRHLPIYRKQAAEEEFPL